MKPITPKGWPENRIVTLAKDQPEYEPLTGAFLRDEYGTFVTEWEPTDEERAEIAMGANIRIATMTFRQPLQPLKVSLDQDDEYTAAWRQISEIHWQERVERIASTDAEAARDAFDAETKGNA